MMLKQKSNILLMAIMVAFCSSISSFAQQTMSTEKKDLILQFRKLTGADHVNVSVNFSMADIQENLLSLVEQDKEITDAQKIELKKSATDAGERLDKEVKAFFEDQAKITPLTEEIIYQIYDKNFSESELRELIAFYRTPTGQKVAAFLPTLSSQVQKAFVEAAVPILQSFIQPKIQTETEQLKQKIKDMKAKRGAN
jgi:hypothetical protein